MKSETGTAQKMWALHGPTLTLDTGLMMVGGNETVTIPIPSFVIQHERGLVLFDTMLAPVSQPDPQAIYGDLAVHVGMDFPEEQMLKAQLGGIGFEPEDVTHVVLSHAHIDHAGGLHLFPHAKFYAGPGEVRYALWPEALGGGNFRQSDIESTRDFDWHEVSGDYDLFGDGSIVLLHLPGHTPGNQGLLVRLPSRTFLLTGDTVHLRAAVRDVMPMPSDFNNYDARRSIERLAHLRDSLGATLWIGHDPEDAKEFQFAPYVYQ